MKIIHTADWHIGKILHKQELNEEIRLFFDWLEAYIMTENPDLLLISGDIFDMANPSNKDQELYYSMLNRLSKTGIETIITGGNHDSVSLLNAPESILKNMKIHVLGGVSEDIKNHIIPVYKDNKLSCIILAIPYLREKDLKNVETADKSDPDADKVSLAVQGYYDRCTALARKLYGSDVPVIAMGHLFMRGSLTSESERDIHVGNLQGIESKYIHPDIAYLALGHIHKPQRIGGNERIRYSGSPVYLDFSEIRYPKQVVIIQIEQGKLTIQPMPIPKFRELLRLSGTYSEVSAALDTFTNQYPLKTFVELDITEPGFSLEVQQQLDDLMEVNHAQYKIIKRKMSMGNKGNLLVNNLIQYERMEEMTPLRMLEIRLEDEGLDEVLVAEIVKQYSEIIESMHD